MFLARCIQYIHIIYYSFFLLIWRNFIIRLKFENRQKLIKIIPSHTKYILLRSLYWLLQSITDFGSIVLPFASYFVFRKRRTTNWPSKSADRNKRENLETFWIQPEMSWGGNFLRLYVSSLAESIFCSIRRRSLVAKSRNRFAGNAEEGLAPFVEFTGAKLGNTRPRRDSENLPASLFFLGNPPLMNIKLRPPSGTFWNCQVATNYRAAAVFSERKMSAQAVARCFIVFRRIAPRPSRRSGKALCSGKRFSWSLFDRLSFFTDKRLELHETRKLLRFTASCRLLASNCENHDLYVPN